MAAIQNKERIILYGDSDPDGAISVIISKEAIEAIAGSDSQITVYFPDREKEGYGINKMALDYLSDKAPALFITLDCGIGNVDEVELAKQIGFEVIIIDHHQVTPSGLPRASIVVDAKQESDTYPFKYLACAGVAYRLARLLSVEAPMPWSFLSAIAGLATLADQMPLQEENEKLVREGIIALKYTDRVGLKALMESVGFEPPSAPSLICSKDYIGELRKKLLPILHSAQLKGHLNRAYLLLTESSPARAAEMVKALTKKAKQRREEIKTISEEVEARIVGGAKNFVFEGDSLWTLPFLGPVASKICQKEKLPCFLFKKGKEKSRGTVRTPSGVDAVKALGACSNLLETYGGHAPAAGFTVTNKNLEMFKECLTLYFSKTEN